MRVVFFLYCASKNSSFSGGDTSGVPEQVDVASMPMGDKISLLTGTTCDSSRSRKVFSCIPADIVGSGASFVRT